MAKRKITLQRKSPKFEEYDLVLIVCEGTKTEPNYFKQLVQEERLSSANIEITGDCGSDPVSVVRHAIDLYRKRKKEKNPATLYDRVYCVIDRDSHKNFNNAILLIDDFNKTEGIEILFSIKSFSSFEFWYLLHFKNSRSAFYKTGLKTASEMCEDVLSSEWKTRFGEKYSKSCQNIYKILSPYYTQAVTHARSCLDDANLTREYNPSTEVFLLTEYLKNIRKQR
ncbi:RloB family protein [Acinetobacter pittii]|uniref:RloB family protein n=1 Tax=Acinetobacter pittii TaxID=48296 RepID=UPI003260A422